MANWCSNFVTFQGNGDDIRKAVDEFRLIAAMSHGEGQQIVKDGGESGYMFEIYAGDEDDPQDFISFMSRWTPVDKQIIKIAKLFNLEFEYEYSELGMGIHGKFVFNDGLLDDYCLTDEDIDLAVPGNEDEDFYIYEGEEYECREEILEQILQDKINNNEKHSTILIG